MIAGASSRAPALGLVTPGTKALSRCSWSGRSSPGPLRAPRFEIFTWGGPPGCGGRSVWRCTAGGGAAPTCPEGTGRGGRREPGRHRELSQRLLLRMLRSEGDEPHGCVLVWGALGYQEVRPAHDYLVPDHRPGSFRLQGMQCPCLPGERHVRGAVDHRLFYLAVCG